MRFQVPQFIKHETKVVGPLTFRQFTYLGIPAGIAFFFYFLAPFSVFVVAAIILGAIGAGLAFLKPSGKSVPGLIADILSFGLGPKTYIWKKGQVAPTAKPQEFSGEGQPTLEEGKITLTKGSKVENLAARVETGKRS